MCVCPEGFTGTGDNCRGIAYEIMTPEIKHTDHANIENL